MKKMPFAQMPVEIFRDNRLSKTDLRVLGVLLTFMNANKNSCYPKRSTISNRCGLDESKISASTSRLEKFGWIKKTGKGGFSSPCLYVFTIPPVFSVTEQATDIDSGTGTKTAFQTVTNPVMGNKSTTESTKSGREGFDGFWKKYPRKMNRHDALKAWTELSPDKTLQTQILSAVISSTRLDSQWSRENGRFIPSPARYLRERRWEDQYHNINNELNRNNGGDCGTSHTRKTAHNTREIIACELDDIIARTARNEGNRNAF